MKTPFSFLSTASAAAFVAVVHLAAMPQARAEVSPISDTSFAGSYLAARLAGSERDTEAAVAYLRALMKFDSRNEDIVERAFFASLMDGQVDEAMTLAEKLIKADRTNRVARLALAVRAIKRGEYQRARTNLSLSVRGPIGDLTATLLVAWSMLGSGNARAGVDLIDHLQGPDWYAPFKDLNAGLILDAAGNRKDAGKRLEQAMKAEQGTLRAVDAYGRWASRNLGKTEALAAYGSFDKVLPNHPLVKAAMAELEAGKTLPPLIKTPQQGAAEVLYGLGAALGRQGGEDLALAYLQLALWLDPDHALAALTLANIYEQLKLPRKAIAIYEAVPADSPLKRDAEVQLAVNLDAVDQFPDARKHLDAMVAADPKDLEALVALGKILQSRKLFAECATAYSQAIALIPAPTRTNWPLFYFRGICNERNKNWAASEADLKTALKLYPDQPHVLNYLGYSWVDQGQNLDTALDMIRKAVALRPDDGYIVDSLGWAYYRLGRYDEAVAELERAVELKPQDPVINDHLGDAYWKAGRRLEAGFQWNHARDLKPEPDDLEKINRKIKGGLDAAADGKPADAKAADAKAADAKPADAKPADTKAADAKPVEAKPADTKPADTKPADTKPATAPAPETQPGQKPQGKNGG